MRATTEACVLKRHHIEKPAHRGYRAATTRERPAWHEDMAGPKTYKLYIRRVTGPGATTESTHTTTKTQCSLKKKNFK